MRLISPACCMFPGDYESAEHRDFPLWFFSSRTTGADTTNLAAPQAINDQPSVKLRTAHTAINWPKSHRDAGVLIVSDDSDSDKDNDGMD